MGKGLQRAHAAAAETRGKRPRPIHLRSRKHGGNNTMCGRGGITFRAPITDDPGEATCQHCLSVQRVVQRVRRQED